MGYRAHVNKKRIVEYSDSGYFNWSATELDDYFHYLFEKLYNGEDAYPFWTQDENGTLLWEWEIERSFLIDAIKYLKSQPKDDIAFCDYTNEYIVMAFEYWLSQTENKDNFSNSDFVYISWF